MDIDVFIYCNRARNLRSSRADWRAIDESYDDASLRRAKCRRVKARRQCWP